MACWSNIEGTWSYKDLIGSRFKLKSIPISIGGVLQKGCNSLKYSNTEMTLKEIHFRVTTDGKVYTLFQMEEFCGKLFLPRDLEVIEIIPVPTRIATICGEFVCQNVPVGNKVSHRIYLEKVEISENSSKKDEDIMEIEEINETDNIDDINMWEIIEL